jgi:hypothetical protein
VEALASDSAAAEQPPHVPSPMHASALADWGTPELIRRLAACVLRPASVGDAIDLDYASSAYWQQWWPDRTRPDAFLDGSSGRDVLQLADRVSALPKAGTGTGFLNAPGFGGGEMVQRCWEVFELDHREGRLRSGVWTGFSLEHFASLQGVGPRHPLSAEDITTLVPSRRARYLLHPEQAISIAEKKLARRPNKSDPPLERHIARLRVRSDDSPIIGDAPPHASYLTILWAKDKPTRRRQMDACKSFLTAQREQSKSLLHEVAVIGTLAP